MSTTVFYKANNIIIDETTCLFCNTVQTLQKYKFTDMLGKINCHKATHLDSGGKQHNEDGTGDEEADDKYRQENNCPGRETLSRIHYD